MQVVTPHGGPLRAERLVEFGGLRHDALPASAPPDRAAHWTWGRRIDWLDTDGDTSERANLGGRVANDDYDARRRDRRAWAGPTAPIGASALTSSRGQHERGFPARTDPIRSASTAASIASRAAGTIRAACARRRSSAPAATFRHRCSSRLTDAPSEFASPDFFDPSVVEHATHRRQPRHRALPAGHRAHADSVSRPAGSSSSRRRTTRFIKNTDSEAIPGRAAGLRLVRRVALAVQRTRRSLTAGVRVERIERTALAAGEFGRPAFDDPDVVWSANPKVSGAWFVRPAGCARTGRRSAFGAGTGIKPPTAFEIAFTNNPGLKPERSRSFDAGRRAGPRRIGARRRRDVLRQSLRRSHRHGGPDRLQRREPVPDRQHRQRQREGAGDRRATGDGARGLSARVAYTWLDTEVLSVDNVADPIGAGAVQRRRSADPPAAHQASAAITWSSTRGERVFLGERPRRDERPRAELRVARLPESRVRGGRRRWRHPDRPELEVYARVTNLFDKDTRKCSASRRSGGRPWSGCVSLQAADVRFGYGRSAGGPRDGGAGPRRGIARHRRRRRRRHSRSQRLGQDHAAAVDRGRGARRGPARAARRPRRHEPLAPEHSPAGSPSCRRKPCSRSTTARSRSC